MTALEMIPTNGKRPDGINGHYVWLQDNDGRLSCIKYGECDIDWDYYIAYCVVEDEDSIPKKYAPIEQEKWVGKLCKFYEDKEDFDADKYSHIGVLKRVEHYADLPMSFIADGAPWGTPYCKPFSLETDSDLFYKE